MQTLKQMPWVWRMKAKEDWKQGEGPGGTVSARQGGLAVTRPMWQHRPMWLGLNQPHAPLMWAVQFFSVRGPMFEDWHCYTTWFSFGKDLSLMRRYWATWLVVRQSVSCGEWLTQSFSMFIQCSFTMLQTQLIMKDVQTSKCLKCFFFWSRSLHENLSNLTLAGQNLLTTAPPQPTMNQT